MAVERFRDVGWLVFAGVWTVFGVLESLGMLVELRRHHWFIAATVPLFVLGSYWLAAGAWLRTTRGKDDLHTSPPAAPVLSPTAARRYIAGAIACVVACGGALLLQFIQTR